MRYQRLVTAAVAATALVGLTAIPSAAGAGARSAAPGTLAGSAGPARDIVVSPATTGKLSSRNWDGYLTEDSAGSTDFNVVKDTWVQPVVKCEAAQAWTVFWVGLDGWFDDTVEQGGSSAFCSTSGGAPSYYLWWEMYPTNSIQEEMSIAAGNTITAEVTYKSPHFVITVKDVTTGKSFTKTESCAANLTCDRSSAEVIAEDVGKYGGSGYFPLADYGTAHFTAASVTNTAGKSGSFSYSAWRNAAITEKSGSTTYATVSALTSSGKDFNATWKHA